MTGTLLPVPRHSNHAAESYPVAILTGDRLDNTREQNVG